MLSSTSRICSDAESLSPMPCVFLAVSAAGLTGGRSVVLYSCSTAEGLRVKLKHVFSAVDSIARSDPRHCTCSDDNAMFEVRYEYDAYVVC